MFVFIKKTTLKEFLHYMQVYLLLIVLMHPEAEPGEQDVLVPQKLKKIK